MQRPSNTIHYLLVVATALVVGAVISCAPSEPPPPVKAEAEPQSLDALAPPTTGENAPIRQLHTVTLCTADLDGTVAFYGDGLGMRVRGPIELDTVLREQQRQLWGLAERLEWQLYILDRPSVPGTIQVRVLVVDPSTPKIHTSWNPQEPGPFSMGFPTEDLESWDAELRAKGYESLMPLSRYQIPRADGSLYGIHETIFNAPDFVHSVAISRRDGMPQLGPVDPATGRGGPVYSAHIIDNSEEVIDFYVSTLGLELRSDRQFKSSGSKGALGVPDGTVFRFFIIYAEGATFGHMLFVDFLGKLGLPDPGLPPRPPNQGIGMWTFPVRDIEEMANGIQDAGLEIVAGPIELTTPSLGHHRALTVLDPSGFMVELFQTAE